jgi:copper chaperone CopZ
VASALRGVDGVKNTAIASDGGEVTIVRKAGVGADADLASAVKEAGYGATVIPTATLQLTLSGLDCENCEAKADKALRALSGMRKVKVTKATNKAELVYETKTITPAKIEAALKKAGFPSSS